ncbi:hypothetical protein Pint_07043 [Pistacia integerrima]|uniref:Uncharacterized protein n=1 Tax=Pistacia integerrima TaxID=434235 RepID=A0ACC0XRR6_9ROSI|nr:hypothetical protein Pint_07043 [Pistacia integerrima]
MLFRTVLCLTGQEQLVSHLLPLLVRGYDDTDPRIQEEVLRRSVSLAKQLDVQVTTTCHPYGSSFYWGREEGRKELSCLVKQAILPRVHGLALKTTVAAVRVNALLCLGDLVHTLDKHAVLDILQTIQRCTAVDRSAPTLMCTLGVANSILKQYGVEFAAEHVLPLLSPLLTTQQLNVQQFAKYMLFVKDILRKIEEKRGVTVTDTGFPELKDIPFANGPQAQALSKTSGSVASTTKSSLSWDEDWGPKTKGPANSNQSSIKNSSSTATIYSEKPIQVTPVQLQTSLVSAVSSQQTAVSCPPIDLEWLPCASSSVTSSVADSEKQQPNPGRSSSSSFEDLDPFADWPPRPSGSSSVSGTLSNGNIGSVTKNYTSGLTSTPNNKSYQTNGNNSWASYNPSSTLNSGGLNNLNSIGFMKQNQGYSGSGSGPVSVTYNNDKKSSNLGSIFGTSKSEQTAPKLAPPPATAVGRGRGRGRGASSSSRPSHVKPTSEQPPLLDLL